MNEKILLIHPGFSKTGTTTFQDLLKFLNVNILAKPVEDQSKTIWYKLFKEHLFKSEYEIKKKEYDYYKLRNDFKDYLKSFFNNQKTVSVFSDEGLLGPHASRSNYLGLYNLHVFKEIIEEIENELNIKIIIKFVITIRKQHDIILSTYYYGGKYSQVMSVEDFFKRIIQFEEYKDLFDYALFVKKIIRIFDPEILILPLELLIKDQEKYIDKLCKFIDLETNIGDKLIHSNKNYVIKEGRKRYFLRNMPFSRIFYLASVTHNWLKKIEIYKKNFKNNTLLKIIHKIVRPKEKKVLAEQNLDLFQNEIKNLYKDSNLELEKLTNSNLKEFDYH
jgi:hypothetical protein